MDERESLKRTEIESLSQKAFKLEEELNRLRRQIYAEKQNLQQYKDEKTRQEFNLNRNHIKLIKEMEFVYYHDGGDYVFIGVDGKRPFGNSDIDGDVARILGWKLPNDELSTSQTVKAEKLLQELPLALNEIISKLEINNFEATLKSEGTS